MKSLFRLCFCSYAAAAAVVFQKLCRPRVVQFPRFFFVFQVHSIYCQLHTACMRTGNYNSGHGRASLFLRSYDKERTQSTLSISLQMLQRFGLAFGIARLVLFLSAKYMCFIMRFYVNMQRHFYEILVGPV